MVYKENENSQDLSQVNLDGQQVTRLQKSVAKAPNKQIANEMALNRVRSLVKNGLSVFEIHKETGLELSLCRRLTKKVKVEIEEYSRHIFFKELKSKIIQIADNHASIQAELITRFWRARDENNVTVMVGLAREISQYDKNFASTLNTMGVSTSSQGAETLPPPESSTNNKTTEIEYEALKAEDEAGVRDEVKASMKRLNEHIKMIEDVENTPVIKEDGE